MASLRVGASAMAGRADRPAIYRMAVPWVERRHRGRAPLHIAGGGGARDRKRQNPDSYYVFVKHQTRSKRLNSRYIP